MDTKQAENLGAEAYRQGKSFRDNPLKDEHTDLWAAWLHGYETERDFWEKTKLTTL